MRGSIHTHARTHTQAEVRSPLQNKLDPMAIIALEISSAAHWCVAGNQASYSIIQSIQISADALLASISLLFLTIRHI